MRKYRLMVAFACMSLLPGLAGAQPGGMNLRLDLPDITLLASPVSPPQLQKEGLPLLEEQQTVNDLLGYIGTNAPDEALVFLAESESETLALLESGDPEGVLKQRVVAGGAMPSSRSRQISATMLYLIGHVYLMQDDYRAAETAFLTALVPLPDYLRVHEALGMLYLQTESFEAAHAHLARAAELGLHTPDLFGALGYLNFQVGNLFGAASAFGEALMLKPDNTVWRRSLLYTLVQSYQHAEALALVENMLVEQPDDADLWLYRADTAIKADKPDIALTSLETAIRLGEDSVANMQVCATLHLEIGSIARAVDLLRRSFGEGLDFIYIEQAMNWLEQQEEWDYLREIVDGVRPNQDSLTDEQRSTIRVREADLSLQENDEDAARDSLEAAINLDPTNAMALFKLAGLHKDRGNYDRAELLFQRASAYELYRENALISLAQLALDQDDFNRALQVLRGVVEEFRRTDLSRNIDIIENLVQMQQGN